ncbi:alkanesulfonate monooxygenase SsuD/methylene tetrahydromethanopterin reductase-like flavin-dependent oxidoreductase (luciferase family) [Pseudonocardia endophytica]|uniref:Alkanesulfonate monooxygenase SsuD/methylene tetrahydromethanopterin reductase-like flavin-dependent oxidoreductase (Luciferase family) n=2 Tax=Pseudonocardia endophytica TaxID=401976 RepID=A0A4R1HIN6_PSEEN|nr:alkanesulfonate monooxygenase SsuD/methylene tetrahydromethanopterin reductase-like flavin-dependent oxidoreductase (luciferase family) [Pseudonocardia endophytica]
MARDGIFLAYNLRTYGNLPEAWLSPRLHRFSLFDPAYWAEFAQLAEKGLFDAVFTGDGSQITDPTTAVADGLDRFTAWTAAIEATEHLGFILTASTTYNDPFRLAERLLSLDVLTGGRLAWNLVTSHSGEAAANFGLPAHPERDTRYARAGEFVDIVTALWASAAGGPPVDHDSKQFVVHGRLSVPPSRQGRPPIIRASTSEAGRDLAGEYANGVFAADLTRSGAIANRAAMRSDARRFGRPEEDLSYLSGLRLVLGSTQAEAEAKVGDIYGSPGRTADQVAWLGKLIDFDVSTLDPHRPLPPELLAETRLAELPAPATGSLGFRASVLGFLRENADLPLDQLLVRSRFVGAGHATFVGTPEQLAERLEDRYRAGAADGFVFAPDLTLDTLEVLVDELVPALQRKGIYKREYTSDTFAGHLRLPPFPAAGELRFDTDAARRARVRASVVADRADPRSETPSAAAPVGAAAPLTADSLRERAEQRPLSFVALSEPALREAVADPDRLPTTPDGYLLGLDRAAVPAPGHEVALDPTTAAAVLGLRIPGTTFLPVVGIEREHPWNLARTVSSLEHWLRGRTGVVLSTHDRFGAAGRAGAGAWDPGPFADPVPAGVATTSEAAEIVRALGDSYPNSALVVDRERRVYATGEGIAPIDHAGAYRIAGPGAVASSFHGRPLIAQVVQDPADLVDAPEALDLAFVESAQVPALVDVLGRLPAHLVFLVAGPDDPVTRRAVADHARILGSVRTVRSLAELD